VTAVRREPAPKLGETIVVQGCGADFGLSDPRRGQARRARARSSSVGPRERLGGAGISATDVVIDIDAFAGSARSHPGGLLAEDAGPAAGADLVFGLCRPGPSLARGPHYVRDRWSLHGARFSQRHRRSDDSIPSTQLVAGKSASWAPPRLLKTTRTRHRRPHLEVCPPPLRPARRSPTNSARNRVRRRHPGAQHQLPGRWPHRPENRESPQRPVA